ncbi:MAG: 3-keto-disaccharide hydrolase [Verrucomicrobiota bacterium]
MRTSSLILALLCAVSAVATHAEDMPKACIDPMGYGWRAMSLEDFTHVNCDPDTWSLTNGMIHSTGHPIGVIRTKNPVTNFELSVEWRHLKSGGNSGVFVWATPESIKALEEGKGRLPTGIEVQVLDHGYTEQYEKSSGKKADWFSTNGDVFPTGTTKMRPFPPTSPNGERSFPRKNLSKGINEWNHYYVRAINGEVRLWVNGEEVSGGTEIKPATGYLCLESEGSPIDFRNLRIRELP